MIYIYVFPVEEYDRNIANSRLKKACLKGKGVVRYTLKEFVNALNDEVINIDTHWVRMIDDNEGGYPITYLFADDLKKSGFDVSNVTESDMSALANMLYDDYIDWRYWESLKKNADNMGIPYIKEVKYIKN